MGVFIRIQNRNTLCNQFLCKRINCFSIGCLKSYMVEPYTSPVIPELKVLQVGLNKNYVCSPIRIAKSCLKILI